MRGSLELRFGLGIFVAAYFVLRSASPDDRQRGERSASYWLGSLLPILFLIFVFPRLPQIAQTSFHPTQTIQKGMLDGNHWSVMLTLLALMTVLASWIYRIRVRAGLIELEAEELYGQLEADRGGSAATGVVRPVHLSDQS